MGGIEIINEAVMKVTEILLLEDINKSKFLLGAVTKKSKFLKCFYIFLLIKIY